jgi:hypothetical protein
MLEGRWTTVTESEFDHERRGLEAIREKLPDSEPWRAWSNFTFTARTGHVREVDLLVVAPGGVFMIELKDWHGSLTTENGTWVQTTPRGRRVLHGNPLHLVNKKAKELASLLGQHGRRVWVTEAVCFTDSSLRVRLPTHEQNGVYTVEADVAEPGTRAALKFAEYARTAWGRIEPQVRGARSRVPRGGDHAPSKA